MVSRILMGKVMTKVLVNGQSSDQINIKDRGLNYGDGVFETIAVHNRQLHYWSDHYQRLSHGCASLGIKPPTQNELIADIKKLAFDSGSSVLKIVVTRGEGGRGYVAESHLKPTVILSLNSWPVYIKKYQQKGIKLRLCQHRLVINPVLSGIKHLNRLDQVIARNEWHNEQIQEGIMLDQDGYLIEGTSSNLFMKIENQWLTAPADSCAVAGVMRQAVINNAETLGVTIQQKKVHHSELSSIQQMMVCNSIWGLIPVTDFESYTYQTNDFCHQLQIKLENEREVVSYVV